MASLAAASVRTSRRHDALLDASFLFGHGATYACSGLPAVDAAVRNVRFSPISAGLALVSFVVTVGGTAVQFATRPDRDPTVRFNGSTLAVIFAEFIFVFGHVALMLVYVLRATRVRGLEAPAAYSTLAGLFFGIGNVANMISLIPSTHTLSVVSRYFAHRRPALQRARARLAAAYDWFLGLR